MKVGKGNAPLDRAEERSQQDQRGKCSEKTLKKTDLCQNSVQREHLSWLLVTVLYFSLWHTHTHRRGDQRSKEVHVWSWRRGPRCFKLAETWRAAELDRAEKRSNEGLREKRDRDLANTATKAAWTYYSYLYVSTHTHTHIFLPVPSLRSCFCISLMRPFIISTASFSGTEYL